MIIALWSWTEPIIYSKLTVPRHANRNVCESRMALPEEKAITWSPILASHHITNGQLTTFWNSGSHVCCRAQRTCITDGRGQPSCTVCTVHTEPWTLWGEEENNTKNVNPIASLAAWLVGFVELDLLDLKPRLVQYDSEWESSMYFKMIFTTCPIRALP